MAAELRAQRRTLAAKKRRGFSPGASARLPRLPRRGCLKRAWLGLVERDQLMLLGGDFRWRTKPGVIPWFLSAWMLRSDFNVVTGT